MIWIKMYSMLWRFYRISVRHFDQHQIKYGNALNHHRLQTSFDRICTIDIHLALTILHPPYGRENMVCVKSCSHSTIVLSKHQNFIYETGALSFSLEIMWNCRVCVSMSLYEQIPSHMVQYRLVLTLFMFSLFKRIFLNPQLALTSSYFHQGAYYALLYYHHICVYPADSIILFNPLLFPLSLTSGWVISHIHNFSSLLYPLLREWRFRNKWCKGHAQATKPTSFLVQRIVLLLVQSLIMYMFFKIIKYLIYY